MSNHKLISLLITCLLTACAAGTPEQDDAGVPPADGGFLADGAMATDGATPPRDGSTCATTDACTLDAQRCSGSDIQTCEVGADGCTQWSAATPCDGALFCSGDMCTDTCVDACTDGVRMCDSSAGYRVCETQASGCLDWSPEQACPADQTCMGAGACMACTDGAERCGSLGEVQSCVAGRWTLVEGCPFGCTAGVCDESVTCTAGGYRCRGANVEVCNSSGSAWLHLETCAVSCGGGLCTGACEPGATRCNGAMSETCNSGGTGWGAAESCTTFCAAGACALDGLEVGSNMNLDGEIHVRGAVVVRSGATVTASTGELTIHADSITIENGASISVAPTGESAAGRGRDGRYSSRYYGGAGGGYGAAGARSPTSTGGVAWGSTVDALVEAGSTGGDGLDRSVPSPGTGGLGGGVLRLIAGTIEVAGQLTANGQNGSVGSSSGGGGGSGGGILVAGDQVTVSGTISAIGGGGAAYGTYGDGANGGDGRVKILHGSFIDETGSTVTGTVTRGVLPPIALASGTHPDSGLIYNDGFPVVGMSWGRPFDPITGYYWQHDGSSRVPTPATGAFVAGEIVSFPTEELREGTNYFLISSVTPTADVGTVAGAYVLQLNRTPPAVSSSSHSRSTTWSMNPDIFLSWVYPHDDLNYQGVYYVFDHYGDTVPTTADTFVSIDQKQALLSGIEDGIWVMHVVSVDTQGYLTREAGHYQVRVGADPGSGTVFGQVTDATTSMPISGATVSVNRGVFGDQSTNSTGNFNFSDVSDGTWELRVRAEGFAEATMTITVMDSMSTAANLSLTPLP